MALPSERESLNRLVGFAAAANRRRKNQAKTPTSVNSDPSAIQVQSFEEAMNIAMTAIIGGPSHVAKDFSTLQSIAKSKDSIYGIINSQKDIVNNINETLKVVSLDIKSVIENITDISIQTQFLEGIAESIDTIVEKLNKKKDKGDKVQLIQLAAGDANVGNLLKSLQDFDDKSLEIVEKIVTELNKLNSVDLTQFKENIQVLDEDVIQNVATRLDSIKDLYEKHVTATAEAAAKGQHDLETIKESNKKTTEVLVEGDLPTKPELEAAKESFENIADVIVAGAAVMLIGALVMKAVPELPELSVKFAITLTIFLGAVLIPISFSSTMVNKYGDAADNFKAIGDIIATAGFVMMIGALFMKKRNRFKLAMEFTGALSIFLLATIAAITIATTFLQNENYGRILEHIHNLSALVATAGAVLVLGALFMQIPNLFKNALLFSAALSVFMLAIMLPLGIISKFGGDKVLQRNVEGMGKLIIAAATIMTIGALFVMFGGGKFVKNALLFGVVFALFLTTTILPLILLKPILGASEKVLSEVTRFVTVCTMIMLIGALFVMFGGGKFVEAALKFGFILNVFLLVTIAPFLFLGLIMGLLTPLINNVANFIVKCAVVMTVGALFMIFGGGKFAVGAIAFGLLLNVFMVLVILPFKLLGKDIALSFATIHTMQNFIKKCTIMLLVGAFFMLWKNGLGALAALEFAALLTAFIYAVISPFILWNKKLQQAYPVLKAVTQFILISAALLMIGAWFMMDKNRIVGALAFGFLLTAFIYGIISPFVVFKGKISQASKSLHELELFIIISAGVLLLGSFIIEKYGWEKPAIFAAVLVTFIGIMVGVAAVLSSNKVKKNVNEGTIVAIQMALGIAALSLAIGLANLATQGFTYDQVVVLMGITIGFSLIFGILSKYAIEIGEGTGLAMEVALGIGLLSVAIGIANFATRGFTIEQASMLFGITSVFVGIFALIGIPPVAALVGLGTVVAIGMGIAMAALGGAILVMSKAADTAAKVKNFNVLNDVVGAFFGLFYGENSVIPGPIKLLKIMAKSTMVTAAMLPACIMIKLMANTVADLANLKVAEKWDKDGNPIKYRHLSNKDFELATKGVAKIITTLGSAIISVYNTNPEIFDKPLFRDTPFKRVVDSSIGLGRMISTLSRAVVNYSNMKIAEGWDKDGNPIKFRKLTQSDFENASKNIQILITTMASSINDLLVKPEYKDVIEIMFDGCEGFLGIGKRESSFSKLMSGIKGMTDIISSVTKVVYSYASKQIPIEWDKQGNAIKFTSIDYVAVSKNIIKVLTSIVDAVQQICVDPYYEPIRELMLDASDGLLGIGKKSSTFSKIMSSTKSMGEMLSTIIYAVKGYANLMFPTKWNNNGQPIAFEKFTDFEGAETNIAKIITSMFNGINLILTDSKYNNVREAMLDGADGFLGIGGKDSKFIKIVSATKALSEAISSVATTVQLVGSLMIPDKWNDEGKPTHYTKMTTTDIDTAKENIAMITVSLADALLTAYDNPANISSIILFSGEKKPLEYLSSRQGQKKLDNIMSVTERIVEVISSISKVVTNLGALKVPDGFDKDGNATGYSQVNIHNINKMMSNLSMLLLSIPATIISCVTGENEKLFGNTLINAEQNVIGVLSSSGNIIDNVVSVVEKVLSEDRIKLLQDAIKNILSYKQQYNITLNDEYKLLPGLFVDLMTLTENFILVSNYLNSKINEYGNSTSLINIDYLLDIGEIINKLVVESNAITNSVSLITDETLGKERLVTILSNVKDIQLMLYNTFNGNLNEANVNGKSWFSKMFGSDIIKGSDLNTNEIYNKIAWLDSVINMFTKTSEVAQKIQGNEFSGINLLFTNISTQAKQLNTDAIDKYLDEAKATEKFVKVIDKVQVQKVTALTKLLEQIDKLSQHMGDLDKFTKVLAEQLAGTLDQLAKQIRDAQRTIKDADRIQRQRHELIDNSIAKVQKMMESTLQVNVTSTTNGSETITDVTEETR